MDRSCSWQAKAPAPPAKVGQTLPSVNTGASAIFSRLLTIAAAFALTVCAAAAQTANWKPPRTPDGQPDLQGTWTNASLTPLQRPTELGSKEFFTEQEAAAFEKQRIEQGDVDRIEGARGESDLARRAYNSAWFDRGTHVVKSRRTSLVVDPPDGRVPALTPEAKSSHDAFRAALARNPADGPEDRLLTERCILFGAAGPPMLPEPYNNNYQIVQSPGYVTIPAEMLHDARIIPLDGRPHLGANMPQWKGNSRGRWEGDTLVVETLDFKFNGQSRFGVAYLDGMSDRNLRVVERFTRPAPDTILYRATVEDPTVYTKPWTVEISMTKRDDAIFEYACHEGNYGLSGILSGTRAEERAERRSEISERVSLPAGHRGARGEIQGFQARSFGRTDRLAAGDHQDIRARESFHYAVLPQNRDRRRGPGGAGGLLAGKTRAAGGR